jgi:hypothetical protein
LHYSSGFFFFFIAGDGTQGLLHSTQGLWHWDTPPPPAHAWLFCSLVFLLIVTWGKKVPLELPTAVCQAHLGRLRWGGLQFETSPGKYFTRPHLQNNQSKVDWRCGSVDRVPALQGKNKQTNKYRATSSATIFVSYAHWYVNIKQSWKCLY